MKSNIKLALAALVVVFASCTSKPAETASEAQDSVATEAPAEPVVEPTDSIAAPADSVVVE